MCAYLKGNKDNSGKKNKTCICVSAAVDESEGKIIHIFHGKMRKTKTATHSSARTHTAATQKRA